MIRYLISCVLIAVFPISLIAADSGAAMVYASGTAYVNGSTVPNSTAVFPGDLLQTRAESVANITASGSSVAVLSNSLVKFEGDLVSINHGGVAVSTSNAMAARAGQVTVTPVSKAKTDFQVTETGGKVQIVAHSGGLSINDPSGTTTLSPGQQTTRYASYARRGGAVPAAGGGILDSPIIVLGGIAAVAALMGWTLAQGSEPTSPAAP